MMENKCLTDRCITCPVDKLQFEDQQPASQLIDTVLIENQDTLQSMTVGELVTTVKDTADRLEKYDYFAGIAVGAIAYTIAGRCNR